MDPASERLAGIAFGRFQVLPDRRELLADSRPVRLGGRAFDVLVTLIEAHGAVVSKDTLMKRVWPDRIIEENSLQHQISALRRVFAADRDLIRTIAGRGYQFIGEVRAVSARTDAQAAAGMPEPAPTPFGAPTNLPESVSELIGRDAELDEVLDISASHRLVTLTGAGGIGKTRLGFEVARHLLPRFVDGVWAIELAPLSDPELVPVTVATALGLELASGTASPLPVANALRSKQLMLVLDNCEHVVEAAARMAEALLRANPAARVIATSREPLRVEGEWVYPIPPLAVPAEDSPDGDDSLRYGAVQLFVERARAAAPHFSSDSRVAAGIGGICRRLDGIPLAIEFAAARASTLGIDEIAARLEDRFGLLTGGRRTALPRHQTLRATLDWSHALLAEPESVILRRLAVFAGPFSLEAATAVAASPELSVPDVIERLLGLVAKSFVVVEVEDAVARYRLLDTTRAYAFDKLYESGEHEQLARRHAEYYRDLFERAETESETRPRAEWLVDYGRQIDNVRAALDWAFSPDGDPSIGEVLTAAAVPLWMHLSLMEECRRRVEQAVVALGAEANRDSRREMKLQRALGTAALLFARGASAPEVGATWARILEIAASLDDTEYELRALWGLWVFHLNSGLLHSALNLAQRFCTVAASRPNPRDRLVGERLIGASQHLLGDQCSARVHVDRALVDDAIPDNRSDIIRFEMDQRIPARVYLGRILWLLGFPDQAMRAARRAVEDAHVTNHAMTLCHALAMAACPIALLVGDLAVAERYVEMLLHYSARHALARWGAFCRSYQQVLLIRRGNLDSGLRLLRAAFEEQDEAGFTDLRVGAFLGELAEGMGRAGQIAAGLAAIDKAIDHSERTEERWIISEFLRAKGELLLLRGGQGAAAAAENHFRQALDWAHHQGALSWELRAAASLARLWHDQNRPADAKALLQPVYDRFTEGFESFDLKAARALLDELG